MNDGRIKGFTGWKMKNLKVENIMYSIRIGRNIIDNSETGSSSAWSNLISNVVTHTLRNAIFVNFSLPSLPRYVVAYMDSCCVPFKWFYNSLSCLYATCEAKLFLMESKTLTKHKQIMLMFHYAMKFDTYIYT